jgi:hypothetical protein
LFSVAASLDLDLVSHDIKTAFLYPSLKENEDIYLRRPTVATDDVMPPIVKLLKCLYGFSQASKYFDDHLSKIYVKLFSSYVLLIINFCGTISSKTFASFLSYV